MGGQAGTISSPFNDISGAAPGAWDWLKSAGTWVKNLADENPTATKWITFGVGAIAGISWGGELADAFFRNFPSLDNWFTRLIVHGLAIFGALAGANALSSWLTNRPGAQEHRQQVAQETADRDRDLLAQRAAIIRANGGNPESNGVDRSLSKDVFLKANANHEIGTPVTIPAAGLRPSGDHPVASANPGQGAYSGSPDWSRMPGYYGPKT